jgi:ribosomal protein S18 acetylase RimI-like enzyme/uncharacterized protein YndB with AHSA1/START domain
VRSGHREITLPVPAEEAWRELVSPQRRDWYFGLTPEGAFEAGSHIRWVDGSGNAAVETDVVEVRPGRGLTLRNRFVFTPHLAALEPHQATWDVTPSDGGCEVRNAWQADEPIAALLEEDAGNMLYGLRLALDPAARAEIARKDTIGELEIRDVTPDRVADYQSYFDHDAFRDYPSWQFCYCMESHRTQSDEEWSLRTGQDNRRDMSEKISSGEVTALLAYEDGKPVGWCNYGTTTHLAGVVHKFGLEAADHEGVGSIACFVIASPYRGHGVASRLLDAAVDRLRVRGLRAVEAYPGRQGTSAQSHYRGPLSMFLRAGFETYRETERYIVVRKQL